MGCKYFPVLGACIPWIPQLWIGGGHYSPLMKSPTLEKKPPTESRLSSTVSLTLSANSELRTLSTVSEAVSLTVPAALDTPSTKELSEMLVPTSEAPSRITPP